MEQEDKKVILTEEQWKFLQKELFIPKEYGIPTLYLSIEGKKAFDKVFKEAFDRHNK